MIRMRLSLAAIAGAGLLGGLACATAPSSAGDVRPCPGLAVPRVLAVRPVPLPASFGAARVGADIPAEVVVRRDGSTADTAVRTTEVAVLGPFAEEMVKRARFAAGTLEGNPVAVRVPALVSVGVPRSTPENGRPADVWVFVPGEGSREARWQLRDQVSRIVVVARPGIAGRQGATVVAVAPNGEQKTLLTIPPATPEIRRAVATGKFFSAAGDYRVELRVGSSATAFARFTVAEDSEHAIVNACEPMPIVFKKIGPGN